MCKNPKSEWKFTKSLVYNLIKCQDPKMKGKERERNCFWQKQTKETQLKKLKRNSMCDS